MLSPNDQSIKPKTYDTILAPKLGLEDFKKIIIPLVENLLNSGVKIGRIVGDNCPTQIFTLAHWSSSSIFKDHQFNEISGISFFPVVFILLL